VRDEMSFFGRANMATETLEFLGLTAFPTSLLRDSRNEDLGAVAFRKESVLHVVTGRAPD